MRRFRQFFKAPTDRMMRMALGGARSVGGLFLATSLLSLAYDYRSGKPAA